jgi:hypothetical protein
MNEVGELHRVLDEENRDIVANQIEIALPGIEFGGETTHIARQVARTRSPPATVEKGTKTGVLSPTRCRKSALVY